MTDTKPLFDSKASQAPAPPEVSPPAATQPNLSDVGQQGHRLRPRFVWSAKVAVGLLGLGLCALCIWSSAGSAPSLDSLTAQQSEARELDARLQDICQARARLQEERTWEPLAGRGNRAPPAPAPTARQGVGRVRVQAPYRTSIAETNPPADSAEAYFRAYGSPEHFAAMHAGPSGLQGRTPNESRNTSQHRGVVLQARLVTAAASEPIGAPVVAVLLRPSQLGATVWPRGTEVHGVVRGGSGAGDRVFAEFTFLRLSTGETCDIAGHAQDRQGRLGVPGRRHLTGATAQSVGIASVGRAAGVAGRELAGGVGRVLGAGVEGAIDSGSDKARRIDRDESVVVAERNRAFSIYLSAAHCS